MENDLQMFYDILTKTLDSCCKKASEHLSLSDDRTIEEALIRVYCKVLLSAKEVITLSMFGFQNGALALDRKLFEGMILLLFLYQNKENSDIVERFFDMSKIAELQYNIDLLNWANKQNNLQTEDKEKRELFMQELKVFQEKYSHYKRFKDYWWTGKDSFRKVYESVNFEKDYMFELTNNKIHLNVFDVFINVNEKEDNIVIGENYSGAEVVINYTAMLLLMISEFVDKVFKSLNYRTEIEELKRLVQITTKVIVGKGYYE